MALAPTALLLRPVPSPEQQTSAAVVSSASLVSSHCSSFLFLHHHQPQSFRPAISRTTQVQEYPKQEEKASLAPKNRSSPPWQQKKASNVASNDKRFQNPPPWEKKSFNVDDSYAKDHSFRPAPWQKKSLDEARVDDSFAKDHSFRPAPWQQGSHQNSSSPPHDAPWFDADMQGKVDSKPAWRNDAEADKSAMARIVEKLRTIQKTYDPADSVITGQTVTNGSEDGVRNGQRVTCESRERASTRPSASYNFGSLGKMMSHDRSDHARTGQRMTQHGSDRARTWQKATGRAATETSPFKCNTIASANSKGSIMQAELEIESEATKFPWERDEGVEQEEKLMEKKAKGPRIPSLAELTLSPEELKRLRILGLQLPERLKIGKLGVTRSIIISIQEQFTTCELVKVRCEGAAAASIKKTHLDIEEKTGGLVVLRTGKIIVVYRGSGYNVEQNGMENLSLGEYGANIQAEIPLLDVRDYEGLVEGADRHKGSEPAFINEGDREDYADSKPGPVANAANARMRSDLQAKREADLEAESILEGLGPRFENWTGLLPIPIDADLLPLVIPNYRPPFRLMPYGVRPRLSNAELTDLRRRARPLAPHFVLGRNRGHHGLAAAMVKLWEKSEIVKIAVKKRVQNTNNLMMSDELKRLTGGVLLSRDKFFITFYRGKDFVPEKVASALVEREASVRDLQELEEKAREERNIPVKWTSATKPSMAVIGQEAPAVEPSWVHTMDIKEQRRLKREAAKLQRMTLSRKIEKKLHVALKKKEKTEQDLQKVEVFLKPVDRPVDVEIITEEERFMFRKLALNMKAYLLIGRRGVFDGVVENMHLHWKHRELVKILVKEVDEMEVQETARMLEYESGGVLVAVTPTKKGQGIIMYRGKNYHRPQELRPRNLLTKRKALKRSLELQRRESLSKNVKALEDQIRTIQAELRKLSKADYQGSQAHDEGLGEGFENSHQDLPFSKVESDGVLNNEETELLSEEMKEPSLTEVMEAESVPIETEVDRNVLQERIKKLERLVSHEPNKIIMYRGWPKGDKLPSAESLVDLTPELLSALEAEEDWEDGVEGYLVDESEDSEAEDEDEWSGVKSFLLDSDNELDSDKVDGLDEGNKEGSEWEDEDDQRAQYANLDCHLKVDGSAKEEGDDEDEQDSDQDSSWDLWGQEDEEERRR